MLTSDTTTLDRPAADAPQLTGLGLGLDLVDHEQAAHNGAHTAHVFTEDQARAYLDQCVKRPPIRALATTWCWSKSSVGRFLSRLDAEPKGGTSAAVPSTPAQNAAITAILDRAERERHEADEDAKARNEMWGAESTSLLIHDQPATAVYVNIYDQIVIRQESTLDDQDDPVCRFEVQNIPKLIARLQELLRAG